MREVRRKPHHNLDLALHRERGKTTQRRIDLNRPVRNGRIAAVEVGPKVLNLRECCAWTLFLVPADQYPLNFELRASLVFVNRSKVKESMK